ncbi:MAG TPA: hypothetical protein VK400_18955 [Pyrinomonadaceae bacterium]|nr:hypothetical protein [Pyrinomonadaceae bacterium]
MTEEKKKNRKRETKAGMLGKNNKQTATTGKAKTRSEKKPENTPKISKEKAEDRTSDKPLH